MDEITLRDVYLILRRHLALVIGLPLLFALLAAAWALFLTASVYRAEATVVVQQPQLQSKLGEQIETTTPPAFSTDELSRMANSRDILQAVITKLRANPQVASAWRDQSFGVGDLDPHLAVSFASPAGLAQQPNQSPPNPLVILRVEAPDGPTAAAAANAWADATRTVINRLPRQRLQEQLDTVSGELARSSQRLTKAEGDYQRFQANSTLEADEAELDAVVEAIGKISADGLSGASAASKARLDALRARANALRGPVAQANVDEQRYRDAWNAALGEHGALSKKLADLRLELASSERLTQVLVPAFAPTRPEPRNSGVKVALGFVLGLMLGLILPFVVEAVRDPAPGGAPRAQARPAGSPGD